MTKDKENRVSPEQKELLIKLLKERFEKNMHRHTGLDWQGVLARIELDPKKLLTLIKMEETGGEPDVIGFDKVTGEYVFCDCSAESPAGRRSFCYDPQALAARKENKPLHSALGLAAEMGINMLTEAHYRELQQLGNFDTKTSSWLMTPDNIRKLGGALFGDRRYGQVFIYHNGADSYYAARGFRGILRV